MKIYFIGSHSVGKTTLSKYFSQKLSLSLLPEIARSILIEQELNLEALRTDLDMVDRYQTDILLRQISEEKKYANFVSDRSFDCLCYTAQHSRIFGKLMRLPELATYIETLKQPDVYLFFIRPSKATMKNDGVRESVNWDGIIAIDSMCKMLLELFELKYYQINSDSMQERVKLIEGIIK